MVGGVTYNADILQGDTARMLRDRYIELMSRVDGDPMQTLSQLNGADVAAPAVAPQVSAQDTATGFAAMFQAQPSLLGVEQAQAKLLDLEDQLSHVLTNVRDRRKFVMHVRDTHTRHRCTGQRRQQDAAQGSTQRQTITAFQRADNEPPIVTGYGIALDFMWQHHVVHTDNASLH